MVIMVVSLFDTDFGIGLLPTDAYLGVLQQGTCDGHRLLASASTGGRVALLKHGRKGSFASTSTVEALPGTRC
jgi:hypothetical protein